MSRDSFSFAISHAPGDPRFMRAGTITTPHGVIKTPAFIPVGTRAAMRGLTVDMLRDIGAQAVLANAYHLYIQPGHQLVEQAGGLAAFMAWGGPTFTDSGGFQILSLGSGYKKVVTMIKEEASIAEPKTRRAFVDDDGVRFKSHRDGSWHRFTPEVSMEIQHALGADICFAFDELTSLADEPGYHRVALDRTHRWAERSLTRFEELRGAHKDRPYQALYGVLQGANIEELRRETAGRLGAMTFDGYGIGGAIEKSLLGATVRWVAEELPVERPRHLLGISDPSDIFASIEYGVDTFDCVAPAREGRNGAVYTRHGRYNIKAARHQTDFSPLEEECGCFVCAKYTRAYIHHLFRAAEMLGAILTSAHNVYFIANLVSEIRESIIDDNFENYRKKFMIGYYKI